MSRMDAQDLTTATRASTTTRFLLLKSSPYKSVFVFTLTLDQLLLKIYSVKNKTSYKTFKQDEFAVVDF